MKISVIGTGFIGSTVGRALSGAGHQVTYGSRHPDDESGQEQVPRSYRLTRRCLTQMSSFLPFQAPPFRISQLSKGT